MKIKKIYPVLLSALAILVVAICYFVAGLRERSHYPAWDETLYTQMDGALFLPREMVYDLSTEGAGEDEDRNFPYPGRVLLGDGWSYQAAWGIWSEGMWSEISFEVADPGSDHLLIFECQPMEDLVSEREQSVIVEVNGNPVEKLSIPPRFRRYVSHLPAATLNRGKNSIRLVYAYAVSRREVGRGMDQRKLAVGYKKIGVVKIPGTWSGDPTAYAKIVLKNHPGREIYRVHGDREEQSFRFERSGTVTLPLVLPDAKALVFAIEHSGGGNVKARMTELNGALEKEEILELNGENKEQAMIRLPLENLTGRRVILSISMDLEPQGTLSIRSGRYEKLSNIKSDRKPAAVEEEVRSRPDIFVVILDAARPDHLGCYGYNLETSPNIDTVAAESIIYRDAFAMVPYTLCSVPTMITGLSFLDHNVIGHEDRLNQNARTLAEYLKEAGYRTVGFSATPNFSKAKGMDQGYDRFHESWPGVPDREARNPDRLTDLFLKEMRGSSSDAPLYAQLHYVPPHEPYDPPAKFDRFGDPAYRGEIDGSQRMLKRINSQQYIPGERDLKRLISLYDGNTLFADDSVGRIFRYLKETGRWEASIVLILSDHGEAFYEHGRVGHNDTVYDEMMKTPFILKLPYESRGAEIEDPGFLSLADIVPTLLGFAGISPAHALEGIDLMDAKQVRESNASRFLYFRSTGRFPYWGIRTGRFKAIIRDTRVMALYDLHADPGERENLYLSRTEIFAGLIELLNREITREGRPSLTSEQASVNQDDEKMLKSLGYLQ